MKLIVAFLLSAFAAKAQVSSTPSSATEQTAGTSTDLFVMIGSAVDRPGLLPRANYNIGIGHTFGF